MHLEASLDRLETEWMYTSVHYEPDIRWEACNVCGYGHPVVPGTNPMGRCDRKQGSHVAHVGQAGRGYRCNGTFYTINHDIGAALWASLRLGGVTAAIELFNRLRWSVLCREWQMP